MNTILVPIENALAKQVKAEESEEERVENSKKSGTSQSDQTFSTSTAKAEGKVEISPTGDNPYAHKGFAHLLPQGLAGVPMPATGKDNIQDRKTPKKIHYQNT